MSEFSNIGIMPNGDLAFYDNGKGCYVPLNDDDAEAYFYEISDEAEKSKKSSYFRELVKKEKLGNSKNKLGTPSDRKMQEKLLNVENGVLNLSGEEIKLFPHDSKHRFTNCLNFRYIPDADIMKAPAFKTFVDMSLGAAEERLKLLLEIIGANISNYMHFKRAYFLIGETNSGKTVIALLIVKVIGEELVSTIPFTELCGKFSSYPIFGKFLNYDDELDGGVIKSTSTFKKLVSMAYMKAEGKGANAKSFHNRAHLLCSGNALPNFGDFDGSNEALFKKMVVLDFPFTTDEDKIDVKLEDKLWEERNIIFSLAVKELHRLLRMKYSKFTECRSFGKVMAAYTEGARALDTFIEERCTIGKDKRVYVSDFLTAFKEFCKDNALDYRGSDAQIKARLLKIDDVEKKKLRLPRREPKAGFSGIGMKEDNNNE